ncbi:CubicO group peptidase, beta-lactamase class C family [Chitinophaga jiangningensis]|uniref:Beta-lactamase n=2 Tax=Chitinophaga jiangningensis TaxID=1419482 RepID=A0A1M6YD28_9BACT|nr:CubicO group peptidase, beta-lactamase class C family [Chitinophaga jiangningensis]
MLLASNLYLSKPSINTDTITDPARDIIDSALNKMITKPLIHAASIGLVLHGKEYIGHYGEMEVGKKNIPNNGTIYEIGSLSKTLTGMLTAKAIQEKKLQLEDEVQQYLGENYPNLSYKDHPVRIKDLLSHTSGIPGMLPLEANTILEQFTDHSTPARLNTLYRNYKKEDFLTDLHQVSIDTVPGYKYAYSSAGTQLMAAILEKVYKVDFEKLLTDYLSENMEAENTKISLSAREYERLAVGYHSDNPVITSPMPLLPWGASGNVKSTVPDMVKYIRFLLQNNATTRELYKPIVKFDPEFSIGYFWNIITDKKLGTYYLHHGGVPRSQCYIYIIPKYELGIFIITNQSGNQTASVMEAALGEILDKII